MAFRGDPKYDAIVEMRRPLVPGMDHRPLHALYEQLMWGDATTPEEVLAAQLVSSPAGFGELRDRERDTWTYACRWPWGDARGILRAQGRTYEEAQLRLRDKLVASARAVAAGG